MIKKELIKILVAESGLVRNQVEKLLEAFSETIETSLIKGEKVTISGLGTFDLVQRKAFVGKHPQTGQRMEVPALTKIRFRPTKSLKKAIR